MPGTQEQKVILRRNYLSKAAVLGIYCGLIIGLVAITWFTCCFAAELKQAKVIKVQLGQNFTITLEANKTTGYEWQLANPLDESMVQLISSEYLTRKTKLLGVGGKQVWVLKALKTGKMTISFKYIRPREKENPSVDEAFFAIAIRK